MMITKTQPVLVYDGDCGICRYWVDYWQKLTGDLVKYHPYQEVSNQYPNISLDAFKESIQFIEPDGKVSDGAKALLRLLKNYTGYGLMYRMYQSLPGFSWLSEVCYTFFSQNRGLLKWISYLFWGRRFEPPRYELITWMFLRCLGCIYLVVFISWGVQILGLIGSQGILPLDSYLEQIKQHYDTEAYLRLPMLFWFYLSDQFLVWSCIAGAILSILVILNFFLRTSLVLLYLLYLSLSYAGQTFMIFQWDHLLLEVGFLAIFLPSRSNIIIWLYRWLAFRFMLLSGIVKIASRDPSWDSLTALSYHFETQPLPSPFAWYAHHFPDLILMSFTAATLIVELIVPFLVFLPRRFRMFAAFLFICLQLSIILTGNYSFFNLLTIAFCFFLFDDAAIKWLLPKKLAGHYMTLLTKRHIPLFNSMFAACLACIIIVISSSQIWWISTGESVPLINRLSQTIGPYRIVNFYGPFAIMTTKRMEIIIEGSSNNKSWHEYEFKYKPGDINRKPIWNIPHQPRLDWQMWFAALGKHERYPWFGNLLNRLLQGNPDVIGLFKYNPFPEAPPQLMRALLYEYHFTEPEVRETTGQWWTRELTGVYYPVTKIPDGK